MHAMTAAHLTLPLGSIVRVTNVKTGHAAVVRITDRGPFVEGRILDLSLAAAKALDVYQPGVAGAVAIRNGWTLGGADRVVRRRKECQRSCGPLAAAVSDSEGIAVRESGGELVGASTGAG